MFISGLAPISVLNGILGKLSNSTKKKKRNLYFLRIKHVYIYSISVFLSLFCFKFRGFPVWLKYVPGIAFRTDNGPFKVSNVETFIISAILLSLFPLF